jgi:hypothetical protein
MQDRRKRACDPVGLAHGVVEALGTNVSHGATSARASRTEWPDASVQGLTMGVDTPIRVMMLMEQSLIPCGRHFPSLVA